MRTKSMYVKRREETDHDMQGLLLKPASVTKDRSHDPKKNKGFKRINWKNEAIELGCKQHFSKDTSCFGLTTNIDINI